MKTKTRVKSKQSRKSKLNRELKRELGKKLLGYSAAAGAVLTIGAGAAEAVAIKVTPVSPINLVPFSSFYLDINSDGFDDLYFNIANHTDPSNTAFFRNEAQVGGEFSFTTTGGESYNANNHIAGAIHTYTLGITYTAKIAANLSASDNINIALFNNATTPQYPNGIMAVSFENEGGATDFGNFVDPDFSGFLGVRFDIPGGSPHFGWVEVEVNADISQLTIYGWGYETEANTAILAGAGQESQPVPEPATLLTLAMGVAGIYAWRRNRKRKGVKNEMQKEYQNT